MLSLTAMLAPGQTGAEEPRWDVAAANAAASACDDVCFSAPPRCPFYFEVGGVALRRDVHRATDAATVDNNDNLALSTRDLDKPFNAGPRFLVGHTFEDSIYQVEFSYFWLSDFNDSAAVRDSTTNEFGAPGNLFSPFGGLGANPIVGLDYNDFVSIREFSFMQNVELNLRRQLPMPQERLAASFLIGVRAVGVREQFEYSSHTNYVEGGGSAAVNYVRTRTRNELYGCQIGMLFEFNVEQKWWINTELKGAICNNAAGMDSVYLHSQSGTQDAYFGERSQNGTSFLGDLAVTLVCRPTPNLSAEIGYQAIWINGMAIAAKNLGSDIDILESGPAQLNHRGSVVYHGPHAGLVLSW